MFTLIFLMIGLILKNLGRIQTWEIILATIAGAVIDMAIMLNR